MKNEIKIRRFGGTSFYLLVPNYVVKKFGLKEGDHFEFDDEKHDGILSLKYAVGYYANAERKRKT